jgi:peptidoglycan/LPS O-acetylase OafA/YrhL
VTALDGLRGVAVLLVFLFHLRVAGFAAGFLGVDVFFVLSGFLITSLLLAEMERSGRISLTGFWARRVRRLLPALVLMLLAVALLTSLTAPYTERSALRGDLLATTTYRANWHFITTSSYFENNGVDSPLQHTWSLAIEEQFYLVWPLVLGGLVLWLKRPRLAVAVPALLGVVLSGVALAVLWWSRGADRAYMGTDARMFEPLMGALGAVFIVTPRGRALVQRAGTALIVLGAIGLVLGLALIRPDTSLYYVGGAFGFSLAALLVVAPAWLGGGGVLRRALEWRPLVWLGAISYGLYLWHWPVIVWLGFRDAHGIDALLRGALAVTLATGVATLSYYAIERPILNGRRGGRHILRQEAWRRRAVLATVPVVMVGVACASVAATTVPPPTPGVPVVMLTGDSVPLHLEVAFDQAATSRGWRTVSAARGACSVSGEVSMSEGGDFVHEAAHCPEVRAIQDALIRQADPDVVVWWDRWSISGFITAGGEHVKSGTARFWQLRQSILDATVRRLTRRGAIVMFVATEPPGKGMLTRCSQEHCAIWDRFQIDHYRDITSPWNDMMKVYAARHPDLATFVSLTDEVCRTDRSLCNDLIDGAPARPDGTHYEGAGQRMVIGRLVDLLAPFLEPATR